jgi:hypothetical protein
MSVIHPRINRNKTYDSLGLFGPILINALIGSFAIAPILIAAYSQVGAPVGFQTLIYDQLQANRQLIYLGISAGTAFVFGLFAGLIVKCIRRDS